MKLMMWASLLACLAFSCFSPNECELQEQYSIDTSNFVLDKGFNKYQFRFDFKQFVQIYGNCSENKNVNETRLLLTSFAPCDQTVNFTIEVNLGDDSYQVKRNQIQIKSEETIDLGVVKNGGPRIDFAEIDIALFCPLCPGDEE